MFVFHARRLQRMCAYASRRAIPRHCCAGPSTQSWSMLFWDCTALLVCWCVSCSLPRRLDPPRHRAHRWRCRPLQFRFGDFAPLCLALHSADLQLRTPRCASCPRHARASSRRAALFCSKRFTVAACAHSPPAGACRTHCDSRAARVRSTSARARVEVEAPSTFSPLFLWQTFTRLGAYLLLRGGHHTIVCDVGACQCNVSSACSCAPSNMLRHARPKRQRFSQCVHISSVHAALVPSAECRDPAIVSPPVRGGPISDGSLSVLPPVFSQNRPRTSVAR